jgi:hypothetical protein
MAVDKKKQDEKRQDRLHPHNGNQGGNRFSRDEDQGDRQNAGDGDQSGTGNKRSGAHKADMRNREADNDQAQGESRSGTDSNED